ncbi:glycosyltransferase [Ahrensia kielensis]|uniref:glycosyltransferase n=1 Tax=Ahrensia kielensis TaxID=76980 RepID=UPI0003786E89|nr:glycosyltransferase family 4 protein [Ahrensia kielensis]
MHLVFASSLVPCGAPESGFDIANHAVVGALRRAGVKVTHFGFKWPGVELADPDNTVCLGEIDPKTDTASTKQKLLWLAKAIANGSTFSSAKLKVMDDQALRAAFETIENVDGVVLNGVPLAGAFEKTLTAKPFIFIAHNVEHISAQANAKAASSIIEKLMFQREAKHLEKLEKRLAKKAQFVLTFADEDRAPLGVDGDERSLCLPLVTPKAENYKDGRIKAFDIGMIGTWTWAPNRIGLEWMLQEVMPHLPDGITLAIAGKLPKGFPQRDKRVQFLGRVLNAKDFLRQCRVIALTSREGTGVQLKTIETFEMGLPAVATHSSIRAIANLPSNVRMADTGKEFAKTLADHVLDVRTNVIGDIDGSTFRSSQIERMDEIMQTALNKMSGK